MQEEARLVQVTVLRKSEHIISTGTCYRTTESVLHYTKLDKIYGWRHSGDYRCMYYRQTRMQKLAKDE